MRVRSEHPRGAAAVRRLRLRARRYLAELGRERAEISLLVVTDAAIRALNRTWRGKDRPTDVLSFPQAAAGRGAAGAAMLGDVVISLDTALRVAASEERPVGPELDRYLAHGILHLLGHDHEGDRDARRMAAAEDALVGQGMLSGTATRGAGLSGAASPRLRLAAKAAAARASERQAPKARPPRPRSR